MKNEELKNKTINKMMTNPRGLLNGILTIGFDVSEEKDHCCLIVAKLRGTKEIMIINEFFDEEANDLLKKLLEK